MKKRRAFSSFNIAFLDIMFCGFGAVVLLVLIVNSQMRSHSENQADTSLTEITLIEKKINAALAYNKNTRHTLSTTTGQIDSTRASIAQLEHQINLLQQNINRLLETSQKEQSSIDQLKKNLLALDKQKQQLKQEQLSMPDKPREFLGDGNRQYLTGLKLGGKQILILVDMSASMLDQHIVDVLVKRNYPPALQRSSAKWQRAIKTVEWLTANLPLDSSLQILMFNTSVKSLTGKLNQWVKITDSAQIESMFDKLFTITPSGGTSLENVFITVNNMQSKPDNIILLTDGLPTQGKHKPTATKISGSDRIALFETAIQKLPASIPVNIILYPMEGDPMAAALYWKLGVDTNGSFFTTSRDWP